MSEREYDLGGSKAAALLNVSLSTLSRWADEERLPCFRTPGGWRKYRTADVLAFAEQLKAAS